MNTTLAVTAFTHPGETSKRNTFNAKDRRERFFMGEYVLIDLDSGACPATLRYYGTSTGGSNSVCVWISAKAAPGFPEGFYINGSGNAGGWGYHRPSQAAEEAFRRAGFTFSHEIGGRGDEAMKDALKAIGAWLGIARPYIHHANP